MHERTRAADSVSRLAGPAYSAAMFYGPVVFDPALIIAQARARERAPASFSAQLAVCARSEPTLAQIIAVQSLFYISLGFLLLLTLGARNGATRACACSRSLGPRPPGPVSGALSLFYFFDYAAVSAHSLAGWCAHHARHLRARACVRSAPRSAGW